MIGKVTQFFNDHIGAKRALIKAIRDDNFKNWQQHFDSYNQAAKTGADPKEMKSLGMEVYEHNLKEALSNLRITDEKRRMLGSIQTFFALPDGDVTALKRKYGAKAVDMLSKYRLQDNHLSDSERYEIRLLAQELGLSATEADAINTANATALYKQALQNKIGDGRLTDNEQQELKALAVAVGLNPATVQLDQRTSDTYQYLLLLNELDKGHLPMLNNPPVVLQRGEVAHWQVPAAQLITKTVTTGYRGGSSGVSIRVMKGVSYRVGSSRSTPIREQVTVRNQGTLVVTSKRVVFAGSGKSFSIGYNSLLSFDPYSDGIGLQKTNGLGQLLQFANSQTSEVTFKILTNAINQFFA